MHDDSLLHTFIHVQCQLLLATDTPEIGLAEPPGKYANEVCGNLLRKEANARFPFNCVHGITNEAQVVNGY